MIRGVQTFAKGGMEGECIGVDCATQIVIQWHEEAEVVVQLCMVQRMVPATSPT